MVPVSCLPARINAVLFVAYILDQRSKMENLLTTTAASKKILPGYVSLIFGILSIAFSALFIRWTNAPGVISTLYRMAISAGIMATPFFYSLWKSQVRLPAVGVVLAIAGGFFFSLDMYFWTTGIMLSGATNPTVLANTSPLWVGLGSWMIFREKQTSLFWVGLIMAVSGAALVLGQDLLRSSTFGLGTLFGVFSAVFYGGYHLISQRGRGYLNTLSYFWISTFSCAVFALIYALILGHPLTGYSTQTWWIFVIMGVLVQSAGWMLINHAQGHIPAAIVSPTLLAQPILTAILSFFFLKEAFTLWHIIGGIMVITGVYTVHRSKLNHL